MSLLMDALKKAEEEKKRAAKRLEELDDTVSVETDADSASSSTDAEQNIEQSFEKKAEQSFSESVELTLEPITDTEETIEDQESVSSKEETSNDNDTIAVSVEDESLLEATKTGFESEDITQENQTLSGMPESTQEISVDLNDTTIIENLSIEDASAPFDDTFHGVLLEEDQDSEIFEETLPGVAAQTLAEDLGGGGFQPTPAAAQTVFTAGKGETGKSKSVITWTILGVLALIAVVSFSVFYYFTITPVSRQLPSPLVARGIETAPTPSPVIEQIEKEPETVSGTIISPEVQEQDPSLSVGEEALSDVTARQILSEFEESQQVQEEAELVQEQIEAQEVVESEATPAQSEVVIIDVETSPEMLAEADTEVTETEPQETEVVTAAVTEPSQNIESTNEIEKTQIVDTAPIENVKVDSRAIEISKNQSAEKENIMVRDAFRSFQNGQYSVAGSLYNDVLKTYPDNRDAHLGLAALAINNNNRAKAYEHYVHLLELDPSDALALNGLISLSNNPDPVKDESTIKSLLKREGDIPSLHFSLGNLYAKQSRWVEAQSAFFNAYRLDNSNPDYVVNLAISLDRMGQYKTARDYYQLAIDLADNTEPRFDVWAVNNRLLALSKQVN